MAQKTSRKTHIDRTAILDPTARIGAGCKIWAYSQIGSHAAIGKDCMIGNGVYVDRHVKVGNRVKIHNKALLYHGVIVEDDVFIGPAAVFTNDLWPRSGHTRDLRSKAWYVRRGASIGANVTVLPDINIGAFAVVGAGAVVTRDVPDHALVCGNPASIRGFVCDCGEKMTRIRRNRSKLHLNCRACDKQILLKELRKK